MTDSLLLWKQFLQKHSVLKIDAPSLPALPSKTAGELARDESFWSNIYSHFPLQKGIINLNNGAVSSNPNIVEKAYLAYYKFMNQSPAYYWLKIMEQGREAIRTGLAGLLNAAPDEVAILRNATEALNNIIFGLNLKEGDEVVACKQDYIKCVTSWKQRELRDKITIRWVNIEGPHETDEEIIRKYVAAFSPKTKVLHLTHVINWNGQILPVKQIIEEAKKRNIEVLLDGAHSFNLIKTDVKELGCDYFGTALHKWMMGSTPSGMLYVAKNKISGLWPLASAVNPLSADIRKFEELSFQLMPNILGLGYAMDYQNWLKRENKEERLRYLRRHMVEKLKTNSKINFLTPLEEERSCAILNINLKNLEPAALEAALLNNYGIHVSLVIWENMKGIRITPNIYTKIAELNTLCNAINELS